MAQESTTRGSKKKLIAMPTKSAFDFYNNPSPGVKRSLLGTKPRMKTLKGVFKHNSIEELVKGNYNQNMSALERELGKYSAPRISKRKTQRMLEGTFGNRTGQPFTLRRITTFGRGLSNERYILSDHKGNWLGKFFSITEAQDFAMRRHNRLVKFI